MSRYLDQGEGRDLKMKGMHLKEWLGKETSCCVCLFPLLHEAERASALEYASVSEL